MSLTSYAEAENEKRREETTEYIKKDELLKFKADVYDEYGHVLYAVPTGYIVAMPPDDVEPVRHGRWKEMHYEGGIIDGTNFDRCSVCGYERVFDNPAFKTVFKYCPNCYSGGISSRKCQIIRKGLKNNPKRHLENNTNRIEK